MPYTSQLQRKLFRGRFAAQMLACVVSLLPSCAQQEVTNAPSQQTSQSGKDGASNASADQLNDVRILLKGESLPDCTQSLFGRVYYLPESKNFKACSADGWNALEMKGEQGIAGDKGERGAAGDKGERGATGDKGDTGARGNDGFSSLATIASEPAGINCQLGGRAFKLGLDKNRNNILDSNEVTSTSYFCTTIACAPDQPLGNAECKTEIANSLNASKPKSCNRTGDGFTFGGCVASSCAQGFYLENNTCKAQTCSPGISIGNVDCSSEAANSKVATKTQTCNVTGNGYTFGACTITGCASGYYLSGGKCLAQTCQPNQSYGSVDCKSEISYSSAASKTKTCNGSGSDYLFGLCKATSCATGYYLDNNSCVAQKCSPNQTLGDVDCKTEIPFAAEASKARSCNSIGNDFTYGACNLKSCGIGYFKSGNSCVAQKCTPNQKLANVSCTSEITNSLTAEKTRTCNSDGSDYIYGSCQALTCAGGYELYNGSCRVISKPNTSPTSLSNGWYDVSKDANGGFIRCDTTKMKTCAYQLNLIGPVFTAYDGVRKTWTEADAQCKSLNYRLPTDKELLDAKFLLASVKELNGPSWPSDEYFWSGTVSADKVYANRVWLPGNYSSPKEILDTWNKNQVLCVSSTAATSSGDSSAPSGGSTGANNVSSQVTVDGVSYTLSGPSTAKVNQCVALTLTRNSIASSKQSIFPGLLSGQGGLFTDAYCKNAALLNTAIAAGTSSMTFYFQSWSEGTTVVDLTSMSGTNYGQHKISVQP